MWAKGGNTAKNSPAGATEKVLLVQPAGALCAPVRSALHGRGHLLVSGQTGDWQEGACPIDARDAEILSFRETGSPCCVCVWRKLERKDPARVGGQGEGAGRQRQTRQSELGRGAPRPPWPMEHRSDTDPEAELVVSEKPLITCRHRG